MKIISGKIADIKSIGTVLSPDKTVKPIVDLPEEVKEAYEERAAIMQYDGGLDHEEAKRKAWCRTACMLSVPSQWSMCERFKPCVKSEGKD